jgi:drug/metabolite transporter (DMT)-like permease
LVAIVLSLGASLAWGVSDFLGGLKSRSLPLLAVLLVSQGAALVLLAAFVLAFGGEPPGARFLGFAALAGLGETIGVAALYRGLASGVMSIVAPVAATAPVVPVMAGLALGEVPSAIQGAGIALAVGGIVLTAQQPRSEARATGPIAASVGFGVLTALGFGSFYVAMDAASEGEIPWALLVARLTSVAVFIGVFLVARPRLSLRRPDLPVVAGIGVLIIAADSMYAIASTHGLLSVVAALSTLYPVVTIVLARQFLDERIAGHQATGIAACLSGAVAISAAA